jgi:hypothetical protein
MAVMNSLRVIRCMPVCAGAEIYKRVPLSLRAAVVEPLVKLLPVKDEEPLV